MFCKKCGRILNIEKIDLDGEVDGKKEISIGRCVCGYSKVLGEISTTEKMPKKIEKGKGAVEDKNELATFPHKCKKCGHEQAQVIEMGVWYSDEAGVVRFKCGKCGYTEQSADSNS